MELRIALFELTSLLLLRDELTPLEFERIDILRQLGLHVMRFEREMNHIVVRQLIDEIEPSVLGRGRQTHDYFVRLVALHGREIQVGGLQDTIVRCDERESERCFVCAEEAERVDRITRSVILRQLGADDSSTEGRERQTQFVVLQRDPLLFALCGIGKRAIGSLQTLLLLLG